MKSRGGEIGIRARLRISWSRDCAGSSPALGTNGTRKMSELEARNRIDIRIDHPMEQKSFEF